jgi:alpha-galactosidase
MKIVIIGAGSMAFTPAILSGFSIDPRYKGATIGLVDVSQESLELVVQFAERVSKELNLGWTVQGSTDRCQVLPGSDLVTTAIGVGGLHAWELDVDIPYKYGVIQPVGDTSGPGGLGRALRHIPVLVEIAWDMERLCPNATLYNFTNPLTVNTQAINRLSKIRCIGLCIGVDLTWNHLCRVVGVRKEDTSIVEGGINHCHWIYDFRIRGEDAMPVLEAALDELDGNPETMEKFRARYGDLVKRPQEPNAGQPLCATLFRQFRAYPGPGDGHVAEFYPQLMKPMIQDVSHFQGEAIKYVKKSYPVLGDKMKAIATGAASIDTEDFARELSWEHTQFLDIVASQQDNLGRQFFINIPNRGIITNLPEEAVVEVPATVDAAGIHPFALGDLPAAIVPTLAHKVSSLDLIIAAAMEGSRHKAAQAYINDPHCTDMHTGMRMINELIDAELDYLPRFK